MVPTVITSIDVGDEAPIARIGAQKTYVFYKEGIETFVIRPGFLGKIEEFGMLSPFQARPRFGKCRTKSSRTLPSRRQAAMVLHLYESYTQRANRDHLGQKTRYGTSQNSGDESSALESVSDSASLSTSLDRYGDLSSG